MYEIGQFNQTHNKTTQKTQYKCNKCGNMLELLTNLHGKKFFNCSSIKCRETFMSSYKIIEINNELIPILQPIYEKELES